LVHKVTVGVLGASGYAGRELCLLAGRHPHMELAFASANAQRGETFRAGKNALEFISADEAPLGDVDLVFCALPHGASREWVLRARDAGAKVVDLSSDFRPGHTGSEGVPYGLTELRRSDVTGADLVANPGCYPTAILLALEPLVRAGLIEQGSTIAASAASGVTGAGYSPRPELLFGEVAEDFRAYSVGNDHRHLAEMSAVLQDAGGNADIVFTPHLLPVARGILATIVTRVSSLPKNPLEIWLDAYDGEACVEITDSTPTLKEVVRRNVVRISVARATNTTVPTVIITSAIDNLTKGAAGQAIQNANLMFGLPETAGLPL
jgi:N-acetyl-gamma-glutamyl-phosphate reductase